MAYFRADQPIFDCYDSLPDQAFGLYGKVPALEDPAPEPMHTLGQLVFNSSGQQVPSDSQNMMTTSMGPPSKPRKPKAPTLRADDWEPYKARIIELHIKQNLPLPEVRDTIKQEFNFKAEYVQSLI